MAQFDWAEIIFLVANWREKEVEALPLILSHKDLASKKVVIGHPPIAKVDQVTGMTRFDKFLQENKRLPDWWELSGLNAIFFIIIKIIHITTTSIQSFSRSQILLNLATALF